MNQAQLRQSIVIRYVNILVMAFYAWGMPMPGNRFGMLICTAVALVANVIFHGIAVVTGRLRAAVYAMFIVDIVTVVPAVYFTGMAGSPFLLIVLPILYTVYFVEFNRRFALRYGIALLLAWMGMYAMWCIRGVGMPAWKPSEYPLFTGFVFLMQGFSLVAAIHASTYLPDPLLRERERQEIELQRQHHRAELGGSLSMVVHELRNPLTTIAVGLETARRRLEQTSDPGRPTNLRPLDLAAEEMERLRRMLENLLVYARDRRGTLRRESVDLRAVVSRAVEFALLKYGKHRIRFGVDEPPGAAGPLEVTGDPDALYQVLVNLIDNAASAEVEGRKLEVEFRLVHADGRHDLVVRDNGRGIPSDLAMRVFEPFVTGRPGGTGLGMPIVKQIIEDHGGRIELTSAELVGTAVRMVLPARVRLPSVPPPPPLSEGPVAPGRSG